MERDYHNCGILSANLRELEKVELELGKGRIIDELVINWQNFAQIRLQLKFALSLQTFSFKIKRHR